jgi:hypothetical protein
MRYPDAREVAEQLADRAEAVCRKYLAQGQKAGNYWLIGDAKGTPGRSMYVRLRGPLSGKGAAGKWNDAASGEHGNLLDIIKHACGYTEFRDVIAEASRFLSLPVPTPSAPAFRQRKAEAGPEEARLAAQRLFEASGPIRGTIAETYLDSRGLDLWPDFSALRFHPRCYYGKSPNGQTQFWPALVAGISDLNGEITAVSRTFLKRDGSGKAPVDSPRRSKGDVMGNGVRFGTPDWVMAAGEGTETTLSLRPVLPKMPLVAATSSSHLSGLIFPPGLRTLIVIRDNDPAGDVATDALFARGQAAGLEVHLLAPELDDLNDDLTDLGLPRLRANVRHQLPASILEPFMV